MNNNICYLQNDVLQFKKHFYLHALIPTICEAPSCKLSLIRIMAKSNFWLQAPLTLVGNLTLAPATH